MIIDGRAIARDVLEQAAQEARALSHMPSFGAFVVAPNAATRSYLAMKERHAKSAGIAMIVHELPEDISEDALCAALKGAEEDAVILQLPLPESVDLMRVLKEIPQEKDADVLSPYTREAETLTHPIAASIEELFTRNAVALEGKHAVVVGQGWLVGVPVAEWLRAQGAVVEVVTKEAGDLAEALQGAEIIVSGTGVPGLITEAMIPAGAIVIDIGTSELGGSIAGDVDRDAANKASLFTPVPGGVGPIAVAFLMRNVVTLARLRNSEKTVH